MYKIVAIIGESGSGKDTVFKRLKESKEINIKPIIPCTTRPKRENEQNGINYYFLSNEEMTEKILNGEMLDFACFNGWVYGSEKKHLSDNKVNVGIFSPDGLSSIIVRDDIELAIFKLQVKNNIRLIRALQREDNPDIDEIFRRYKTDRNDFFNLQEDFNYFVLENNTPEELEKTVFFLQQFIQIFGRAETDN